MLSAPILTVFLATVLPIVHTDVTTAQVFDMKHEDFVFQMNHIRRELAKRLIIPNMHELTWSQEHVDNIQSYFEKAGEFHFLPGYKFVVEQCNLHLKSIGNGFSTEQNMNAIQSDLAAGMLAPLYHTIGCGSVYVLEKGKDVEYYGCAISPPSSMLDIFHHQNPPGSECAAGYVNNDGLCSQAPTTIGTDSEFSSTTTQTETSPDPDSTPEISTTTVESESTSEDFSSTTIDIQTSEATSEKPAATPGITPELEPQSSPKPTKKPETTIEISTTQTAPKTTPEPEPITSEPSSSEPTITSRPESITEPKESTITTPESSSSTKFPQKVLMGDYDYFHGDWEEFNSSILNNPCLLFYISALLVANMLL